VLDGEPFAHSIEGGTFVAVGGDQEPSRREAMHLDQPVRVAVGATSHKEGVVVVLVELRTLSEVDAVLESQCMEAEDVMQQLEVALDRTSEVEPEEGARPQAILADCRLSLARTLAPIRSPRA
jgi:hypothetical protein